MNRQHEKAYTQSDSTGGSTALTPHPKVSKRVCDDIRTIGNESLLIQLARCWFSGRAISNAKIHICFSNKIYGSNFVKQHSEAVTV